jgi:hypothetical protein
MADVQRRLALRMKLNKIDGVGVTGPVLLNELLYKQGYQSNVVQGYCTVNGESCWHVWVESGGIQYDIGYTLACLEDPEFSKCQFVLTRDTPAEYQKDDLVITSWELYLKDHKEFWKKMPKKVQDFRYKMLREK